MTTNILVLASNPQGTEKLRLNPEIREIEDALEKGKYRDRFFVRPRVAVRVKDLQRQLQKSAPRIVHFCGHGTGNQGLVLETDSGQQQLLDTQAIADLFKLFKNQIECVILNACYSDVQAKEIRKHINYVIGTQKSIKDNAAVAFSKGFYEALSNGETIERAFKFGQNRIQLEIYGESKSNSDRKLVPIYSDEEHQWREIEEHKVLQLLVKNAPLNTIQQLELDVVIDRQKIVQRPLVAKSPYRGLKKFNAKDKDLFFGRDRLIYKLIEAINQNGFVLVLGASGSGKSSVMRAGVIPQLEASSTTTLQSCLFTPNRNPFRSLHRCLLDPNKDIFRETEVEFVTEGAKDTINRVVDLLQNQDLDWLIFIDQFEELFLLCGDEQIRNNFMEGLIQIVQGNNSRIKLVLAMRSDFIEELSVYPQFVKLTQQNIHLVTDMEPNELRQAIENPAAKHGIVFELGEPDLVTEMIEEVQGHPGSLPLLQYTLDLLWKKNDLADRMLNISTYHQIGGVTGALEQRVNQIYQKLPEEQQLATKQILLRLVDVLEEKNQTVSQTAVSRRAYKSEFVATQMETVAFLIDQNLLISNDSDLYGEQQSTVEIAHEALLSCWSELKVWMVEAQETISLNNRLAEDAALWQYSQNLFTSKSKPEDELWGGSKLAKVIELREDGTFDLVLGGLSKQVNNFIDASILWRDREIKAKLDNAEKLAQANKKARIEAERRVEAQKKAKIIILFFTFALGILSVGLVYFLLKSHHETRIAQLRQEGTTIKKELNANNKLDNLTSAIKLVGKNQKYNIQFLPNPTQLFQSKTDLIDEVHSSLYQGVEKSREEKLVINGNNQFDFVNPHRGLNIVEMSKNGKYIVTFDGNNSQDEVKIWKVNHSQEPFSSLSFADEQGHQGKVLSLAISNDGKYIVSGGADQQVKLWRVDQDQQLLELQHTFLSEQGVVLSVAISNNNKYIVSGGADHTVKLWDINQPEEPLTAFQNEQGHQDVVLSVTISNDNKYIVSGGADHAVKLWDVNQPEEPLKTFQGHEHSVTSVTISDDGKYIVSSGHKDNKVKLWSADTDKQQGHRIENHFIHIFQGYQGYNKFARSVAIEGNEIVGVNIDKTIRHWSMQSSSLIKTFTENEQAKSKFLASLKQENSNFTPDELDEINKLWQKFTDQEKKNQAISQYFESSKKSDNSTELSLDQEYIFLKGQKNQLELSDQIKLSKVPDQNNKITLKDQNQKTTFVANTYDAITSINVSNNGKYIVLGSKDNKIRLSDLKNISLLVSKNQELRSIKEPIGYIFKPDFSVAISNYGKYVVINGDDNKSRLWNIKDTWLLMEKKAKLEADFTADHVKAVTAITVSNDGKYIVTGSRDKTVKLWDKERGLLLHTFSGHETEVTSVAISDNGKYIISRSQDKKVILWQGTDWKNWLNIGCDRTRLNPNFISKSINQDFKTNICLEIDKVWQPSEKAEFLVEQGLAYIQKGEYKNAETKYDQALKLDPNIKETESYKLLEDEIREFKPQKSN